MQLDRIAFLIQYINGKINDKSDDIIPDAELYDYICKILDKLMTYEICSLGSIKEAIDEVISDYSEVVRGAKERLVNALEIIIVAYYATLVKKHSDEKFEEIFAGKQ